MEDKPQFKCGVVLVACIAIFIIVLDSSAMNVAISAVVVDLHTDLSTIQALIAIYALTMASLMLAGSKLQDVLWRKKTFLIGLIVYGIGTTTATLSVNVFMLLIGWSLLEGIGAALMLPATTTMVSAAYEGKDRLTAFGICGGIAALGAAIGPLYGWGSHVLCHVAIDLRVRTVRCPRRNRDEIVPARVKATSCVA